MKVKEYELKMKKQRDAEILQMIKADIMELEKALDVNMNDKSKKRHVVEKKASPYVEAPQYGL